MIPPRRPGPPNQIAFDSIAFTGDPFTSWSPSVVGDDILIGSDVRANLLNRVYWYTVNGQSTNNPAWFELEVSYTLSGARVAADIRITNLHSERFGTFQVDLATLIGSFIKHNQNNNMPRPNGPRFFTLDDGSSQIWVSTTDNATLYFNNTSSPLRVTVKDVPAGGTVRASVNLDFVSGTKHSYAVIDDVLTSYRNQNPQVINWSDRRPVGTFFPSQTNDVREENPSGWINAISPPGNDARTPAGQSVVRSNLLTLASTSVTNCLKAKAQGCIIWSIEGTPTDLRYPGAPADIDALGITPGIDGDFARKVCDLFYAEGLRVGVCIRPQIVVPTSTTPSGLKQLFLDESNPDYSERTYQELARQVEYSVNVLGASIFYIDSTVFTNNEDIARDVYRKLALRYRDCLFIPELPADVYWSFSAGYRVASQGGVSKLVRYLYPEAIAHCAHPITDPNAMAAEGNLVAFHAWWGVGWQTAQAAENAKPYPFEQR